MKMSDNTFNCLKFLCMVLLPALTTFYVAVAKIWDFPYATQVAETSAALCTLIGAILGLTSSNYYKEIAEKKAE